MAMTLLHLAGIHLLQGEADRARPLLERAWGIVPSGSPSSLTIPAMMCLAVARADRRDDVLAWSDTVETMLAAAAWPQYFQLWAAVHRIEAYLLVRETERATRHAGRALEMARANELRGYEAWALHLLGEINLHRDAPVTERAESEYRAALVIAGGLGMRPLQAHCHLGLGKLYRRVGRAGEARTELSHAVEMLRAMGMAHWLPEAERELSGATSAVPAPPPG